MTIITNWEYCFATIYSAIGRRFGSLVLVGCTGEVTRQHTIEFRLQWQRLPPRPRSAVPIWRIYSSIPSRELATIMWLWAWTVLWTGRKGY